MSFKVKHISESWLMRLGMFFFGWWLNKMSAITLGRTFYIIGDWSRWGSSLKMSMCVHEATHVRQGLQWPVIHTITYLIGSPWLIGTILSLLFLHDSWVGWTLATVFLGLSTTGWIFPHMRAWWEFEAYRNGDKYMLHRTDSYEKRRQQTFSDWSYFWMGGFLTNTIARRLTAHLIVHQAFQEKR